MATQATGIDISAYKDLFLRTGREHIGEIRNSLLMIRLNPEDVGSLAKLRIGAHSMKGQCLAMGYEKTAIYCRLLEYIFTDALEKKKELKPELIGAIKDALVNIENSYNQIEKNGKEIDLSTQEKALEKLSGIKIPSVK